MSDCDLHVVSDVLTDCRRVKPPEPIKWSPVLWGVLVFFLLPSWCAAEERAEHRPIDHSIDFLLTHFCYPCHNAESRKGDVDLTKDKDSTLVAANRKVWKSALMVLESEEMPPKKEKRQPSPEQRKQLMAFIENTLGSIDCATAKDPGRPAARRLNRTEYDNSIRALFGLDLKLGEHFSPDGSSYGFDTIADALSIAPVQVEQYYDAAGKVLDAAFKDRKAFASIFTKMPTAGSDQRALARTLIANVAERAYRRPIDPQHLDEIMRIFDDAIVAKRSFPLSVKAALTYILISPRFLIRIEESSAAASGPYQVSSYDMASRLSFFLWSSPPDAELMDLAKANRLQDPEVIEAQARRMLKDSRSQALVENFAGQWLQLRNLENRQIDKIAFPEYTASLKQAIREEPSLFISEIIRNDRPVSDLLDANYTFLNEELARHYGIEGVKGSRMQRIALTDRRRGGVVTMAAILTLTADPGRTNIPRRGNYVLSTILGTPPPSPPANVPPLPASADDATPKTLRQRLEMHRRNPECASCHAKMDPLGFGLEHYDAIGRWRDNEAGIAIDATGTLPSGESFVGPVEMKKILMNRKNDFVRSLTESMLIYALGRGLQHEDECVIKDALAALERNDWRFSSLVVAIVRSFPFTHRRNTEF